MFGFTTVPLLLRLQQACPLSSSRSPPQAPINNKSQHPVCSGTIPPTPEPVLPATGLVTTEEIVREPSLPARRDDDCVQYL